MFAVRGMFRERTVNNNVLESEDCMMDNHYSSGHYLTKVLENLNVQRRESSCFCDVEIIAGDNKIYKAHKSVLAASSLYFRAMFTGGLCEKDQNSVKLHNISSYIVEEILNFIYSGSAKINENNVQELMATADMLELEELVEGCIKFLSSEIHPNNAIGIYRFAEALNCTELISTAAFYIENNFPVVCNEDEIYELPKELFIKFISSEQLRIDSEYQVFKAALHWIKHDIIERRRYVFDIFKYIRTPLISLSLLEKAINESNDSSLIVALKSIHSDLVNRKGCLVPLTVQPRRGAKKDIFVIGGSKRELNTVWDRGPDFKYAPTAKFDTFTREWNNGPNLRTNRIVPGVTTLNGLIYVIGGEQESKVLSCGECFDPNENAWMYISDMQRPRCEFGLTAVDGCLYAIGGWIDGNIGGDIEKYNPRVNYWTYVGELPEPRFSMGVVSYEGLIYVVGGCSESTRFLQDLLCYNPMHNEWRTLMPMSTPRSQMGVAVLDDYLYVVGGTFKDEVLDTVERYSFKKNKWSSVKNMNVGRSGPAVVAVDGILYAIGGLEPHGTPFYRAQCTLSSMECYDPNTDCWNMCPNLPESRAEAGAVVV